MGLLSKTTSEIEDALGKIDNIEATFDTMFTQKMLSIYPVGAIYMSVSSTSPASLFGGTWEQIQDRFLLAAGSSYAAGNTGGEAAVTIQNKNLPSDATLMRSAFEDGQWAFGKWDNTKNVSVGDYVCTYNGHHSSEYGVSLNNMPPYLVVYVWKRIA